MHEERVTNNNLIENLVEVADGPLRLMCTLEHNIKRSEII
jgi:hypothetical protein